MILSAVRTAATYVAVSLYSLIIGPPAFLLAMLLGRTGFLYVLAHGAIRLGLTFAGIRYRVCGAEHLPRERAAVYCSNHQSNIDPPVLFNVLHPRMHVLYKAELGKIPILGRAFRMGGFIAVDRRHKEQAMRSIEQGAQSLRSGNAFLIFPEGTRSRTEELLPFKKGGFIMAIKAHAPIVPIAIRGGRDAMRRGSALIHPVTVTIQIGEPIETGAVTLDDRDEVIAEVRRRIQAMLDSEC